MNTSNIYHLNRSMNGFQRLVSKIDSQLNMQRSLFICAMYNWFFSTVSYQIFKYSVVIVHLCNLNSNWQKEHHQPRQGHKLWSSINLKSNFLHVWAPFFLVVNDQFFGFPWCQRPIFLALMTNFSGAWSRPDVVVGGEGRGLTASNDQWLVWSPADGTQGDNLGKRKRKSLEKKERLEGIVAGQGNEQWLVADLSSGENENDSEIWTTAL